MKLLRIVAAALVLSVLVAPARSAEVLYFGSVRFPYLLQPTALVYPYYAPFYMYNYVGSYVASQGVYAPTDEALYMVWMANGKYLGQPSPVWSGDGRNIFGLSPVWTGDGKDVFGLSPVWTGDGRNVSILSPVWTGDGREVTGLSPWTEGFFK